MFLKTARTRVNADEFFKACSSGQTELALSLLQAADQDLLGAQREGAAALTRAKSWPEKADAMLNELLADANQLDAKRRAFSLKLYALIPSLAYRLAFMGFVVLRLLRRGGGQQSLPRV